MIHSDFTIQQQSLSEQVYDKLKLMILSGHLEQGKRIPEVQIAQQFQVSRTPIREALKKLSDYGLVAVKPRSYSVVVNISAEEARQIAEFRVHLEQLAIELFVQNAAASDYDDLTDRAGECLTLLERDERARAFESDSLFHLLLMKVSGNKFLYEAYEKLEARIQLLRLNQRVPKEDLLTYLRQHHLLVDYLREARIDEARKLIADHSFHHLAHDRSAC